MKSQLEQGSSQRYAIALEVVLEDPQDSYPALVDAIGRDTQDSYLALVDAIGRDTIDTLSREGFIIEPVYTGQRGGFLVDILIPFLNIAWSNKGSILADSSALVTLIMPIFTLVQHLREAHEKRVGKEAF